MNHHNRFRQNPARALSLVSFLATLLFLLSVWGLYTVDEAALDVGYGNTHGLVTLAFDEAQYPTLTVLGRPVPLPVQGAYVTVSAAKANYAATPAPLRLGMQLVSLARQQYDKYLAAVREADFRMYILEDGF